LSGPALAVAPDGLTVSASACVSEFCGPPESLTRTVKLKAPVCVGVPESTPPEESERPAGIEPEVTSQV
jgi:hypothetical protein